MHDGIDTDFFSPKPGARMVLPGLDLSGAGEVVTYATRGMEPYRGFPQFMRAADILLKQRPDLHIVVGGDDSVSYSRLPPRGRTYKQMMLEELPELATSPRLHFVGPLDYPVYRDMLRATDVHVYLTVPFVLSWSILEALSTGCLVVGADNAAVREVIDPGVNGLLADFFSTSRHRREDRFCTRPAFRNGNDPVRRPSARDRALCAQGPAAPASAIDPPSGGQCGTGGKASLATRRIGLKCTRTETSTPFHDIILRISN